MVIDTFDRQGQQEEEDKYSGMIGDRFISVQVRIQRQTGGKYGGFSARWPKAENSEGIALRQLHVSGLAYNTADGRLG